MVKNNSKHYSIKFRMNVLIDGVSTRVVDQEYHARYGSTGILLDSILADEKIREYLYNSERKVGMSLVISPK